MNYELLKLKNDLNVLFIDSPGATAGSVQIWFRAGSALEGPEDHGIAHFLEHMFFKGTQKRPGAQIAHDVESFGGEINAFTSFDYTCYYINYPNKYMHDSVEILLDMVSNPMFLNEDLVPERDVVHEEYRRSIDSPNQYAFMVLQHSCFTEGYQHSILGSEQHIKNFSREQLLAFREKFYNKQNALFVVSGDIECREKLAALIEPYTLPSGDQSRFPHFTLKTEPALELHEKSVRMVQVNIAVQGVALQDLESAAEDLAFNCLGHGESSPLHRQLVLQDSVANQAVTSSLFMNHGSAHFLKLSIPFENLEKALDRLVKVLETTALHGFEEAEVQRIKNQYIASKVYEMESLEAYAFSLGHSFAQTGDISSEENFLKSIKQASRDQVNLALREILSRNIHVSVQVPKDKNSKAAKNIAAQFSKKINSLKVKIQPTKVRKSAQKNASKFDSQVQLVQLKEGVNLLYRQNIMNPTYVMHAYLPGGLAFESEKNNGIYHLISSMMTKGYEGVAYRELKEELENFSASLSGFAGKNAYGLTLHAQTENFTRLTEHFFGSLIKPSFNNKLLQHEKKLTLRNLDAQVEDPVRKCFQLAGNILFAGHPYSRNMLGDARSVKGIKKEDLASCHHKMLKSNSILLTYCGDLSIDEVRKVIDPHLKSVRPRKPKKIPFKKVTRSKEQLHHLAMDREQTHLFYGVQIGELKSKDNIVLKMLTAHLSGQSSELFVEVRDRQGLCYSAQPIHFSALEAGYWGIYMGTGNEKVSLALKAIQDILNKIRDNCLSKDEFERIKRMMEGQALINVQTNDDYANIYSVPFFQGMGVDHYHKENESVREFDYQLFLKTTKSILSRPFTTVIVGAEPN
jgi:zinc protease